MKKSNAKKILIPIALVTIVSSLIILCLLITDFNTFNQLNLPDITPNAHVASIIGILIMLSNGITFTRAGLLENKKLFILLIISIFLNLVYIILFALISMIAISLMAIVAIIVIDCFILSDEKLGNYSWIYFVGFIFKVYMLVLCYAIVMLN